MKLRYIFLFVLLYSTLGSFSLQGQVIIESEEVSALIKSYALSNKQSDYINGWRIQIIATTDRLVLENTKIKLQKSYRNIPHQL